MRGAVQGRVVEEKSQNAIVQGRGKVALRWLASACGIKTWNKIRQVASLLQEMEVGPLDLLEGKKEKGRPFGFPFLLMVEVLLFELSEVLDSTNHLRSVRVLVVVPRNNLYE